MRVHKRIGKIMQCCAVAHGVFDYKYNYNLYTIINNHNIFFCSLLNYEKRKSSQIKLIVNNYAL